MKLWWNRAAKLRKARQQEEARERVTRGAAVLDAARRSWFIIVDGDKVDLESDEWCVLGQAFGSFGRGYNMIHQTVPSSNTALGSWSEHHGFMPPTATSGVEWREALAMYKAEWQAAIQKRRDEYIAAA